MRVDEEGTAHPLNAWVAAFVREDRGTSGVRQRELTRARRSAGSPITE